MLTFIFLNIMSSTTFKQFPPITDCRTSALANEFTEVMAEIDKQPTMATHGLGYYQCYCVNKLKKKYLLIEKSDLCYDYQYAIYKGRALSIMSTVLIALFNKSFELLVIFLVNRVGLHL